MRTRAYVGIALILIAIVAIVSICVPPLLQADSSPAASGPATRPSQPLRQGLEKLMRVRLTVR
ncbi:MAG: hypothetical protein ACLFVU_14495, partial [Phycisphaerae bacterium]